MPAVHVTPIPVEVVPLPVEVTPIPAEEVNAGDKADQPSDQPSRPDTSSEPAGPGPSGDTDAGAAQAEDAAQDAKPSGADTSTVALTVVEAKTP